MEQLWSRNIHAVCLVTKSVPYGRSSSEGLHVREEPASAAKTITVADRAHTVDGNDGKRQLGPFQICHMVDIFYKTCKLYVLTKDSA